MRVGIYTEGFGQNKIFEKNSIGENLEYSSVSLRKKLYDQGIELCTTDMYAIEKFDVIVFNEVPKNKELPRLYKQKGIRIFLQISESEIVDKKNWNKSQHSEYEKVLVWNDKWVDNKKYFQYFLPNKFPENLNFSNMKKEKLCTLIASNRFERDKRELYTQRLKAIKWFEKNQPQDFDFYGYGWDVYKFKGRFTRVFNRVKAIKKIFAKKFMTYKGIVTSKNEVLRKYKFSICYENAKDIDGYITEKIFDCFFAGCVPIYWGAPNVTDFIPQNTFIRKENFVSYEMLYDYLINMNNDTYLEYLENIKNFLQSNLGKRFSAENYSNTFIKEIIGKEMIK